MKKTLALLLALLMVTSCMVFTTAAEETATVAQNDLKIVPVDDCTGPGTVQGQFAPNPTGEGWYGNAGAKSIVEGSDDRTNGAQYYDDGTFGVTVDGRPLIKGSGNVVNMAFHTSTPRDISDMTMLEFDLYLENAAGIASATFEYELRSAGYNGDTNEAMFSGRLAGLVDYVMEDGWNHIEIPISKFNTASAPTKPFDPTQWNYFRMFAYTGVNTTTGAVDNPANVIGTEGKTTVIKIDNVFFSNSEAPQTTNENADYLYSSVHSADITTTSGHGKLEVSKALTTPIDARGREFLEFDVYLPDMEAAVTKFYIELTSSGTYDKNEDNWLNSLTEYADMSDIELAVGWNHIKIPLVDRGRGGCAWDAVNYGRIFSQEKPAYTEVTTHKLALARMRLTGDIADEVGVVPFWSANGNENRAQSVNAKNHTTGVLSDLVTADGTLGTDGIKEYVWFNNDPGFEIAAGNDFAWFNLIDGKLPYCEDFAGVQFDIWMSDATFAAKSVMLEVTSSGGCDKEERSVSTSLNNFAGRTLEAGKWETVTIPLSKLTGASSGANGIFDPMEFDFIRLYWTAENVTFADGLKVATRNYCVLNYPNPTMTENGDTIITMDGDVNGGAQISVPGVNGDPNNKAGSMLNVAAGGTLVAAGAYNVNDTVLKSAVDISNKDHIGFDLYLENVDYWGSKVRFLMGITSAGTCDKQQIHSTGKTIPQMFGDYVVNADGTPGTLKDGWNHIEMPIYSLFYGQAADFTTTDESKYGVFNPENWNYYRTYAQGGTVTTAEMRSVAAIDNIYFFDGATVGTRDDLYDWGVGDNFAKLYTTAVAAGTRSSFATFHPFDITDKDTLVMDVYVSQMANYTGSFALEISSNKSCDNNESQGSFTMQGIGAKEGEWTTVEIPLTTGFGSWANVDLKNIIRLEVFPGGQLPNGYQFWVDNVHFIKKGGIGTRIASAQPTLTESIDITTKMTVATADVSAVAVEYVLSGDAGTTRAFASAAGTLSPNGMNASYAFDFDGIPAHRMTDTLTMTVWYTDADGVMRKGETREYSVQQYAKNMLKNNSSNAKLVTLLSDLLTYGAAVQTYANNYNADALATDVGEGITLKPTTTFTAPEKLTTVLSGTAADDEFDATFKSATLVLDGTVKIRYSFTANTVEGLTVNVGGKAYTEFMSGTDANGNPVLYVDVPVNANHFGTTFTANFNGNTNYVVNYSVNHYIATKYDETQTKTAALLAALYNYGASAVAYAGN